MRQFIRRGFILLLLVLQGVAPLLHAHARAVDAALGIHLPEFETLFAPRAEAAMQAPALQTVIADSAWVGVTMGLSGSQTSAPARALPPAPDLFAIAGAASWQPHPLCSAAIALSPLFDSPLTSTFRYHAAAPRAPPSYRTAV